MPWFRIDDSFADHPKVMAIPRTHRTRVVGVWAMCGLWSAKHLTDGFVPATLPAENGAKPGDPLLLVNARVHPDGFGLWEAVDGGWLYHDWADYQPMRKAVQEKRDATAERVRKWRAERDRNAQLPDNVRAL